MNVSRLKIMRVIALAVMVTTGSIQSIKGSILVVDRGLPDINLNAAAGSDRSNYAFGLSNQTFDDGAGNTGLYKIFSADDFALDSTGDPDRPHWQIDRLSVWVVASSATSPPGTALGNSLDSISLYFGQSPGGISSGNTSNILPLALNATLDGNNTNDPFVVVTEVTYIHGENFQGGSGFASMFRIDFFDLGKFAPGDFVFAIGGEPLNTPQPFVHGSNAGLSGTPQDGANGYFSRVFSSPFSDDVPENVQIDGVNAYGLNFDNGFDKPADLNVQVYATAVVPEPTSLMLLGLGGLFATLLRRR